MKYFTPELFEGSNSDDVVEALKASDDWRRKTTIYNRKIKQMMPRLPVGLADFLRDVCLHDASFLEISKPEPDGFPMPQSMIYVLARHHQELFVLGYRSDSGPRIVRHDVDSLKDTHPLWLYDEVHERKDGRFSHDILLSNGVEISIDFADFRFIRLHSFLNEDREFASRSLEPARDWVTQGF